MPPFIFFKAFFAAISNSFAGTLDLKDLLLSAELAFSNHDSLIFQKLESKPLVFSVFNFNNDMRILKSIIF
jgi:hypothetical protein